MNFKEISKQSLSSLAANKLRSSLTLLAIVVGVFAIISSSTAVLVLDTYFKETLSFMGGSVVNISKYPSVNINTEWAKYRNRKDVTFETLKDLENNLDISQGISPLETFQVTKVVYSGNETEPSV